LLAGNSFAMMPGAAQSPVLMCMNAPDYLGDAEVRRLLLPFGALKAFNLLKVLWWGLMKRGPHDRLIICCLLFAVFYSSSFSLFYSFQDADGKSRGTFVFEYEDGEVVAGALAALNGLPLHEVRLSLQRVPREMANTLLKTKPPPPPPPPPPSSSSSDDSPAAAAAAAAAVASAEAAVASEEQGAAAGASPTAAAAAAAAAVATAALAAAAVGGAAEVEATTPVLKLDGMVGEEDLAMASEVAEIAEDVREEAKRFGAVKAVLVPALGESGAKAIICFFSSLFLSSVSIPPF
jgi:hypothetical protein